MKVLHKDLRHGIVKVSVENLDDLWYLSQVIQPGDQVRAKSTRRIKEKTDALRAGGGERKTFTLTVRVEKMEFKGETDTLRISGVIEDGPQDYVSMGSHHTFNVEEDNILTVIKEKWLSSEIDRVNEAVRQSLRPKILVAIIDDGDVCLALVRESRIVYTDANAQLGGKYDTSGREKRENDFYTMLTDTMVNITLRENVPRIILAGAGFYKTVFLDHLKGTHPELASKCVVENISSNGRNGVKEVLNRKTVEKVVGELASARDMRIIEELMAHIGRDDGLYAYSLPDVSDAAKAGAVEKLLLTDEYFIENRGRLDPVMLRVKDSKGLVHIIDHTSEAGRQVKAMGGVAGILRYKTG